MRGRDCLSVSDGFTVGVQLGVELSLLDLGNMATIGAGIGAFLSKCRAVTGAQRMGLGTRQIAFATFVGNAVILTLDPVVDLVAAWMIFFEFCLCSERAAGSCSEDGDERDGDKLFSCAHCGGHDNSP